MLLELTFIESYYVLDGIKAFHLHLFFLLHPHLITTLQGRSGWLWLVVHQISNPFLLGTRLVILQPSVY